MERHERIGTMAEPSLPEDFAARLGRLEELSGLSLEEFARRAGLSQRRAREWRAGAEPSGDEMWALACWADALPGGWDVFAEQLVLLAEPDEDAAGAPRSGTRPGGPVPRGWSPRIPAEAGAATDSPERIEDFEAPPFPDDLDAWMERMNRLESESPQEFAAELRAFEERMEEWAPGPGLGEPGGMCSWMRLTLAASEAREHEPGGGAA